MEVEDNKMFVVSLGDTKYVVQSRGEAIQTMKQLVKKAEGEISELKPEIIEVDMSGEKWSLTGIPWDQIALELMKGS